MKNKTKRKQNRACRTPATGKKKPVKVAKRKTAQAAKARRKSPAAVKPTGTKLFEGASEISMTENKIAVTRQTSNSAKGSFVQTETRTYHDRTPANMRAFQNAMNNRDVKKVTIKLK